MTEIINLDLISACKRLTKSIPHTPAAKMAKTGFKFKKQSTTPDIHKSQVPKRKASEEKTG